jgi:hypothetical protein
MEEIKTAISAKTIKSQSEIDSLKAENETQLESAIISKGENTCKQSDVSNVRSELLHLVSFSLFNC